MPRRLPAAGRRIVRQVRNPWQVPTEGLDRLPPGGAIVACNRSGAFDHLQVVYSLGRAATVVIDPDAGLAPWPTLRRTSWAQDRSSDGPAAVLARGELLVVFPEVFAAGDGAVHKGNPRVAALALSAGVPIVPAVVGGGRSRLRLAEPIPIDRQAEHRPLSDTLDGYILRGLTDTLMLRIADFGGLPYVDQYAKAGTGPTQDTRAALQQIGELRALWRQRRAEEEQRRAAEAELVRLLDEQDRRELDEAAQAAQAQAEQAAAKWRQR